MLLRDPLYTRAVLVPFRGDDTTASISGRLLQAGRFRRYEPAQRRKHLREARLQKTQKLFWKREIWHGAEMLSMSREQSNRAKSIVTYENLAA